MGVTPRPDVCRICQGGQVTFHKMYFTLKTCIRGTFCPEVRHPLLFMCLALLNTVPAACRYIIEAGIPSGWDSAYALMRV